MPMNPRLLRPLASGWTPRQLPGLALWLDAADTATVTVDTGVSEWRDKSGRGLHASQATSGSQPSYANTHNGRKVVTFDGTDDHLAGGAPATTLPVFMMGTMFFPSRKNVGVIYQHFSGSTDSVVFYRGHSNTDGFRLANTANLSSISLPADNAWHLMGALAGTTSANSQLYYNGSVDVTGNAGTATPASGGYYIARWAGAGANPAYTPMRLGEFVGLNRVPTLKERQLLEGYLAWKWGLQSQLPYDHPYARSFPGYGSQALPTDPDAQTYLAAVSAADGTGVEVGVANAINDFITGCKADGIWDAIKASCILAGARTLAGALVPLRGVAPTNNNFVSGDYDRETGLVGDGSTKYLDSNRAGNADPQNSFHTAVYLSTISDPYVAAAGPSGSGLMTLSTSSARNRSGTAVSFSSTATAPTLVGHSRADASTVSVIANGTVASGANASNTPSSGNILLPGYVYLPLYSSNRIAFYSIGESLDLEALDNRVSTLITAIGAAI